MKQRENEKVRTDREEAPSVEELSQRERTMLEMIWRQFIQHRPAVISSVVILLLITACALAFLSPYDPYDMDLPHKFEPPSPAHPMGRDPVGRDLLTRILYGGRMSLIIGIAAMVVGQVIGVTVGSLAGYFGGALQCCPSPACSSSSWWGRCCGRQISRSGAAVCHLSSLSSARCPG